jgi:AraC-like DNA-binding protein
LAYLAKLLHNFRMAALLPAPRKLALSDWSHLKTQLIWIYQGQVQPEYRHVETGHFPGQSGFLILEGDLGIRTPRGETRAGAGQWIFPKQGVRLQHFSEGARVLSIHFDLQWPDNQPLFEWDVALVLDSARVPRLEKEARRLLRTVGRIFPGTGVRLPWAEADLPAHLALQRDFGAWLRCYVDALLDAGQLPSRLTETDPRVLEVIRLLDRHVADHTFQERQAAQHAGLSISQLDRLFVKHLRMTPKQYLEQCRVQAAMELIQGTDLSIKQVSYELGFSSLHYFSRWYRKKTGLTPTAFRQAGYATYKSLFADRYLFAARSPAAPAAEAKPRAVGGAGGAP